MRSMVGLARIPRMMITVKKADPISCSISVAGEFTKSGDRLPDGRWLALGESDLQRCFMAVIRAFAKPITC